MLRLKFRVVFFGLLLASRCFAQNSTAPSTPDSTPPPPVPERVRVSEILISTPQPYDQAQIIEAHQKAEEVLAAIRRGDSFSDSARVNSQGPTATQGGDIGYFTHGKLAPSLDQLVFRMKVGDVSDVVRAKQGFVILQVTERSAVPTKPNPFKLSGTMKPGEAIQQATREAAARCGSTTRRQMDGLEILSDTEGVDFGSYLENVKQNVKKNWVSLIKESDRMKKGNLAIEFAITKDGKVGGMKVLDSSGDVALDRAAWGGITASNPFPPLPSEFGGQYLALRFRFSYNPDHSTMSAPN